MKEFLKKLFGLNKKSLKTSNSFVSQIQSGLKPAPNSIEINSDMLAERMDSNIAIGCRLLGDSISGLPLRVKSVETIEGKEVFYVDDNHPANLLIESPNFYHDGKELITHYIQSLILGGNAYTQILKVGQNVELWPVINSKMTLDLTDKGIPSGYIYNQHQQGEQKFKLEEILHIRLYNCNTIFTGRSHIEPIRMQILETYYAELYNKSFFKNDATPGGIFTPDYEITPEQATAFLRLWNELNQGAEKAHRIKISTLPGKFQTTTAAHSDIAFLDLIKLAREKCFGVMGIPPTMAGVMEFASYANALMEQAAYWENTVIPLVRLTERALTRQLMWPYFGRENVFQFDLSGVKALKADELKEAQTRAIYVRSGIITVNEVRADMDKAPVEWGDEPATSGLGLTLPGDMPTDGTNAGGDNASLAGKMTLSFRRKVLSPRYKTWKSWDDYLRTYEIRYSRLVSKFFARQKKRVIDKLNSATVNGMMMSILYANIKAMEYRADNGLPNDESDIFNLSGEKEIWVQETLPFIKNAIKTSGQKALNDAGLDVAFTVNNPEVRIAIDRLMNRSKLIQDTTFDKIKDLLQEAYADGASLGELEKNISSLYSDFGRTRAELIARTEMGGVLNAGTQEAYMQAGLEQKEWLATQDEATRDAHAAADGQIVDIGMGFEVGGEVLMYPGDPAGQAGNVINCRCTILPILKTDNFYGSGRLEL